jgi:Concanavalin A-like lectin/glucanases superfamily/Immunoglobulin domain
MKTKTSFWASIAVSAILCLTKAWGQTNIGQWDFEQQDLRQTAGANLGPLTYYDGTNGSTIALTLFGATTNLGVPNINGQVANIMKFAGKSKLPVGYLMPTPPANGGGSLVNDYTIIVDVLYTNSEVFRPIVQMDDGSLDNIFAYFGINLFDQVTVTNTSGVALPSGFFSQILPNTWYRIGMVLNQANGEVDVYTNGVKVGLINIGPNAPLDSPYALFSGNLPLFSSIQTNVAGFVNSVQIRDVALNAGQMAAIGPVSAAGIPIVIPPVSTFIESSEPLVGDQNVLPQPNITVVLNQGDTTVDPNSIQLFLDGAPFPSNVNPTPPTYTVSGSETNVMAPASVHTVTVTWNDNVHGAGSNSWHFSVFNYQSVTLPAPFYFENFDEVIEGSLPAGWYATNKTAVQGTNYDLCDPASVAYEGWLVINTNRLCGSGGVCSGFECDTLNQPPIELNGSLIDNLAQNKILYFESDNRCSGCYGQAGWVYTPDLNCSGQTNVFVCFNSLWMQNRNSLGTLEYSIDQGAHWLPALYCITDSNGNNFSTVAGAGGSRIIYTNGVIDVQQTFYYGYPDQVGGFNNPTNGYDAQFVLAPITTNLIPFIQGFPDDGANYITIGGGVGQESQWIGKEIEQIRLVSADNHSRVRFRFGYTGRCSWYWGIDNFGLYSINAPVIAAQPESQTVDAGTTTVFTVDANGAAPLFYQWQLNGVNITNATNATYTITPTSPTNAGTYTVIVRNVDGPVTSSPATLTVNTSPAITTQPAGEIADSGASVSLVAEVSGGVPRSYSWFYNGAPLQTTPGPVLTLNNVQAASAGNYQVAIQNSYGAVTSVVAILKVWTGSLSSNLVVHLTFDGDLNDTSGRTNNATYQFNGANAKSSPTFLAGKLGSAFQVTTLIDSSDYEYATLGYPVDLQFADTNDFSVSFWCNYTNQGDDIPFISNKDWDSSSNPGWGIFTQTPGNYRINVTGPNQGADKYSETDTPLILKDGNWHHIAVSIQKATFGQFAFIYGYLDGVLVSKHPMNVAGTIDTLLLPLTDHQTAAPAPTSIQSQFQVNIGQDGTGIYTDNHNGHLIGLLDDFGIWRRAITANEVAGIYKAGNLGKNLSQVTTPSFLVSKVVGHNIVITWVANPVLKLQQTTSLNPSAWSDVPGTLGAGTATVLITGRSAFFRLSQ